MKIETKFSHGDVVYYATVVDGHTYIDCAECNGAGSLKIEGKQYSIACRECRGRGRRDAYQAQPSARKLTIGQVRIEWSRSAGTTRPHGEIYSVDGTGFSNYSPIEKREESYMAVETGIGSGSVYPVEDLFSTEAEALERAALKLFEWKERRAKEEERERKEQEQYAREFRDEEEAESDALS